jgi:hypothetical protein
VRAVEVTGSNIGGAPTIPKLMNQIPSDQDIGSVTADGAYDSHKCHEAITARDAHEVVLPRKNAKPWKPTSAGAIARNNSVNAQRYLGRTLWRSWSGYHRRSRFETKMHCITTRPIGNGSALRAAGRRNPNPLHNPQSLHCSCYICHGTWIMCASGKRERTSFTRFVQQNR